MAWETIWGQEKTKNLLQEQLGNKKISHAYLFIGPEGVGKKLTAEVFARALNCLAHKDKPCETCLSCRQVIHGNSPLIAYFTPPGKKIKIDEVRQLCKRINLKLEDEQAQVLIIDGADKLTLDAANHLLKTLEEPPPNTHFILLAEEKAAVLPTILSRCQIVLFTPLEVQQVVEFLVQDKQLSIEKAETFARISQGSIGLALKMLGDDNFLALRKLAQQIYEFKARDAYDILKMSAMLEENKEELPEILNMVRYFLRDAIVSKSGAQNLIINKDKLELFTDIPETLNELLNNYKVVDEALNRLKQNANRKLALDVMLLTWKLDRRRLV